MFEKEILGILAEDRKNSFVSNDDNLRVDYSGLSPEKRAWSQHTGVDINRADRNKNANTHQAEASHKTRINFNLVVRDYVYIGESELSPEDSIAFGGKLVSSDKVEKLVKEMSNSFNLDEDDTEWISNLCYKLFVKFLKSNNALGNFDEVAAVAGVLVTIPEFGIDMRFDYSVKNDGFVLAQF